MRDIARETDKEREVARGGKKREREGIEREEKTGDNNKGDCRGARMRSKSRNAGDSIYSYDNANEV